MDINNLTDLTDEQVLQRLLDVDTVPEKTVVIPRLDIPVTIKGITGKQVFALRNKCTYKKKTRRGITEEFDGEAFNCGLIALATVKPNWGDSKLLSKFKASGPEEVIKKVLLAGELESLGDAILDLSGYNVELEDVKNL